MNYNVLLSTCIERTNINMYINKLQHETNHHIGSNCFLINADSDINF